MSVLSGILGGIVLNLRATRAARQIAPADDGDSSGKFPILFNSSPTLLFILHFLFVTANASIFRARVRLRYKNCGLK
jgi:hypothetical protein